MKIKPHFDKLPIKRRDLTDGLKAYRVYKDPDNFVVASGKTVTEALAASGVTNAYRVALHDNRDETVLDDKALGDHVPKVVAPPVEEVVAEAPAEAAEPAAVVPETPTT